MWIVSSSLLIYRCPSPTGSKKKNNRNTKEYFRDVSSPAILVLNKIDLIDRQGLLPIIETYAALFPFKAIIPVSALTGDGTDSLLDELLSVMPRGPRYFPEDIPTDASERFLSAEIIREKIFLLTGQEIPYGSAVMIDSFKENPDSGKVTIHATIFLERPSQKGIVIGKGGAKLKSIGIAARKDIEKLLQEKVSLHLWVKIRKNWTQDERFLKEPRFLKSRCSGVSGLVAGGPNRDFFNDAPVIGIIRVQWSRGGFSCFRVLLSAH